MLDQMTTSHLLLALLAIAAGATAGYRWGARRSALQAKLELMPAIDELSRVCKEQALETTHLSEKVATETRRRVEVVEIIAQAERERNQWKEKYWEAALGHSAAQEMLLREIERLSRLAILHKVPRSEVNPSCKRVVEEYLGKHQAGIQPPSGDNRIAGGGAIAEPATNKVDSPAT